MADSDQFNSRREACSFRWSGVTCTAALIALVTVYVAQTDEAYGNKDISDPSNTFEHANAQGNAFISMFKHILPSLSCL